MIDILVWEADQITYYRKIEVTITDMHVLPEGSSPNTSLISANDWHSEAWVLSVPEVDPETGEVRTFEQREAILIEELKWKSEDIA